VAKLGEVSLEGSGWRQVRRVCGQSVSVACSPERGVIDLGLTVVEMMTRRKRETSERQGLEEEKERCRMPREGSQ
jgi:hypothetical protein